jgi:hypothetical protein
MTKRRLELMPEVLPDPTPHWDKGAPRSRTLDHLARLRGRTAFSKSATAEKNDDGTIVVRVPGAVPPEAVPFGYGIAFVRVEARTESGVVLRFRALPDVPAACMVIGKTSVKVAMDDLAVTTQEIP